MRKIYMTVNGLALELRSKNVLSQFVTKGTLWRKLETQVFYLSEEMGPIHGTNVLIMFIPVNFGHCL